MVIENYMRHNWSNADAATQGTTLGIMRQGREHPQTPTKQAELGQRREEERKGGSTTKGQNDVYSYSFSSKKIFSQKKRQNYQI